MNQCALCGKFRKWDELQEDFIPMTEFRDEEVWLECKSGFGCQKGSANVAPLFRQALATGLARSAANDPDQ